MSIFDCFQNDCKFRLECQTTRVFVHVQNIDQKHRSSQHKKCLPFHLLLPQMEYCPTNHNYAIMFPATLHHAFHEPIFCRSPVDSYVFRDTRPRGLPVPPNTKSRCTAAATGKNADLRSWKIVNHSFLFKVSGTSTTKGTERFSSIFAHHLHHTYKSLSVLTILKISQLQRIFMLHFSHLQTPNSQPRTHANASHDNCQVE